MKLTSPQLEAHPRIEKYLSRPKDGAAEILIVEAFSGVGKSLLVESITANVGLPTSFLGEHGYEASMTAGVEPTIIIDYRDETQVTDIYQKIQDQVDHIVLLSHPRKNRNFALKKGNLMSDLLLRKLPITNYIKIDPMTRMEVVKFIGDNVTGEEKRLLQAYGLGIPGHIKNLRQQTVSEDMFKSLTKFKLHEIAGHAGLDRSPRSIEDIIGTAFISDEVRGILDDLNPEPYRPLREQLGPSELPMPIEPKTLSIYEKACDNKVDAITIFVPEIDSELVLAFGLGECDIIRSSVIGFASGCSGRSRFLGKSTSIGADKGGSLEGYRNAYIKSLEIEGEDSLIFSTTAHGGFSGLDGPIIPYGLEVFLQNKGIPYIARYIINGKLLHRKVEGARQEEVELDIDY